VGSKRGWADDIEGDQRREAFVSWLRSAGSCSWFEARYGADDNETWIARSDDPEDE